MSDFSVARDAMWPAFAAAGVLLEASTVLPGRTSATTFQVAYRRPDFDPISGMQSADYAIQYQQKDAPTLVEGAEVLVGGCLYVVREPPRVDSEHGGDGFWKVAQLTRVGP